MTSISNNEAFLKLLKSTGPGQKKQTTTIVILSIIAALGTISAITYYYKYRKALININLQQIQINKLAGLPPNGMDNSNDSAPSIS
jgi:hypothetical protein